MSFFATSNVAGRDMKLAPKLTIAIAASALLLFGGAGALQLRIEEHDLQAVATNEALLLARSLQTAFENALRDRQIEDVTETLGALARVDPSVAIFVFDEEGLLVGASSGVHATEETIRVEGRARASPDPVVAFDPPDLPQTLRVGVRLRDETPESSSAIVLEKPLNELRRDLDNTRRQIALSILAFVVIVAGVTWALSRRYVGRPLGRLVAGMKRVRKGDLGIPAAVRSDDEVGETQREFELLVQELDQARARADQEQEARRRIERGLEQADKLITLGQLSAVMAHGIGSPLQVLEGRARALLKHAEDPASTRRTADLLIEQTSRITGIVGQMLSITRRRAPRRINVDAEPLLRRVALLVELEARRRSVSIEVRRAGATTLAADPDQLQQVVLNLLRNALDAAPSDSVVMLTVGGDADALELLVDDDGPGVTEAVRPHLFEPFFTTKAERGGSGLGLSVVKSIVLEHWGTVEFLAREPSGCRVCVRLPRASEQEAA
jgi:signal transduction histidine kinase